MNSIVVALAVCTGGAAPAQEAAPTRPQAEDTKPHAQQAPKTKPHPRRRSVQQIITSVPPPAVAPSWGPVLAPPAAPAPISAPVAAGLAPGYPPPPAALNSCAGNLCTDSSGATYNTGTGNAAINSQGRLCNRVGDTMQCF